MKKQFLSLFFATTSIIVVGQNVAINGTGAAPNTSAMLDISSTNSGLLIPRMTTVQRTAIATPATGLRVYDTTTNTHWFFNGVVWVEMLDGNLGWRITGNALTSSGIFGSTTAQDVRFFSNNIERARLISTGEFVVNNTTAYSGDLFSVYSSGNQYPISAYVTGASPVIAGTFSNNSTSNSAIGVLGSINSGNGTAGVRGIGSLTNGNGLSGIGQSSNGFGLRASSTNASGTGAVVTGNNGPGSYLTTGTGLCAMATTVAVWGRGNDATQGIGGIFSGNNQGATTLAGGVGAIGVAQTMGVAGISNSATNGINRSGGYFDTNAGQSYAYVGARTAGNVNRKIEGNGTVNTTVKDLNNNLVVLSAPESPENLFQDFGVGKLENGKAHITIDPIFTKNIVVNEKHPIQIFIQLKGDCNGVFVTNESATGFDVIELKNGKSNVRFSYFVSANRADELLDDGTISPYSSERFAPAIEPQKLIKLESKDLKAENLNN